MLVLILSLVLLNYSQNCYGKVGAACASPCVWVPYPSCSSSENPEGCCQDPSCDDGNHDTESLCTTVGDDTCTWDGSNCKEAICGDVKHNTQPTCTTKVSDYTCVWNPSTTPPSCQQQSCQDYNHRTESTCTGTQVNGNQCGWNPSSGGFCDFLYCSNFTSSDCDGTELGNNVCAWNATSSSCSNMYCSNFSTSSTCVNVGSLICQWDEEESECSEVYCGEADNQNECSGMPTSLGCKWTNRGTYCSFCSSNEFSCSESDDEEECNGEASLCGCKWSDGKCTDVAFHVVVPTLLVALLLIFLL